MNEGNVKIDYYSIGHPLTKFRSYFSNQARIKMFDYFMNVMKPTETTKVLDLGVTPDQILIESNFFEKMYPYKNNLTAASIEDAKFLEEQYTGITFVLTEPDKPLPFKDNEFDILFCSAVIEHVGSKQSQKQFINECLRVSRNFFFTTPNRQFPFEFHTYIPFIHWFPQKLHQAILRAIGKKFWASTDNLNLFTPNSLLHMFPDELNVKMHKNKLFGLPSNLVVYGKSK